MATWLSPHFALEELTATQHREFDNTPPAVVMTALQDTALRMEGVRHLLGDNVIAVSSGYRCPDLNAAVGGSPASAHLTGHAVDFLCLRFGSPLEVCRAIGASDLPFDQIIQEGTWSHISFGPRTRRQLLSRTRQGGYVEGISP